MPAVCHGVRPPVTTQTHGVSSILDMQAKGEVSFDSIHREIKEAEHEQLKRKKSTESTSFGNYARDGASSPGMQPQPYNRRGALLLRFRPCWRRLVEERAQRLAKARKGHPGSGGGPGQGS